ncbi:MAG: 2-oxopent-4-enoate hydratase [Deltaproteobacteria bacterium]|nr:2-oxopent-4-enoate hydratase [Deltaproteobacteria bacterium]
MPDDSTISAYGDELFNCMMTRSVVQPLTERESEITIEDSYRISQQFLRRRLEANNETVVGKKIGVTSNVVQSMLGVFEPDFGFLTDAMQVGEGEISIGQLIQPRAEAEIAFRLSRSLKGPGVTADDVLAATEAVLPCFEIVDSRIDNWQIKIQDTVADNASCGIFVLGSGQVDARDIDLPACKVTVKKNGQFLSEGFGSAVQGSPLEAVAWLANTFGRLGMSLDAGEVVLSGSLVPLEPIVPGDVMTMEIPGIGTTTARFVD